MKKLKLIVPFLMAAIMVLAIPFTAACKKKKDEPVTTTLQSISVETVKSDYYVGEDFDSSGLVVTANLKKSNQEELVKETVTDAAVIDSSAYDKTKVGNYEIKISYTYENETKETTCNVTVKDVTIEVDTSAATLKYLVGDELNTSGLKVYSNITAPGASAPERKDVTDTATINWNAVNLDKEDTYTVNVSHKFGTLTKTTSFTVRVINERKGLDVKLAEGVESVIELSADKTTASIDPTKIVVRQCDKYGDIIDTPLAADKYDVKVYNKQEEVLVDDYTSLKSGSYQIMATLKEDTDIYSFALINVVDNLQSLTFNSSATGTKLTQLAGKDTISKTWQFTAKYASGVEKTLSVGDLTDEEGKALTVLTATDGSQKVTAYYKDVNVLGVATEKSVDVAYTVSPLQGIIDYNVIYSVDAGNGTEFGAVWGENEGSPEQVSFAPKVKTFKANEKSTEDGKVTYTNYGEIKAYASQNVEFTIGADLLNVDIKVYVSHATKDTTRTVYLTKGGQDIEANLVDSKAIIGEEEGKGPKYLYVLSATDAEAGTYSVFADNTVRIYAVEISYQVDYGEPAPSTAVIFSGNSLTPNSTASTEEITWNDTTSTSSITFLPKTTGSKIGDNSKYSQSIILGGENVTVTNYIDTQGGLQHPTAEDPFSACIKFTLTKACKITYYAIASGDATDRYIVLADTNYVKDGTFVYNNDGAEKIATRGTGNVVGYTINVTADMISATSGGTFYLGTKSSGCYIFAIVIEDV